MFSIHSSSFAHVRFSTYRIRLGRSGIYNAPSRTSFHFEAHQRRAFRDFFFFLVAIAGVATCNLNDWLVMDYTICSRWFFERTRLRRQPRYRQGDDGWSLDGMNQLQSSFIFHKTDVDGVICWSWNCHKALDRSLLIASLIYFFMFIFQHFHSVFLCGFRCVSGMKAANKTSTLCSTLSAHLICNTNRI